MPQKQKLTPEEKVRLVQQCLAGEIGACEAGRIANVDITSVKQWIAKYESEGAAGFIPTKSNRVYSAEVKLSAVLDYLAGEGSSFDIFKKYKIRHKRQLMNWLKVYNAHGDFNSVKFSGGGSYMKQGRDTTLDERIQIASSSAFLLCFHFPAQFFER